MDTVAEIIAKHFHYAHTEAEEKKPITAKALRDFGRQVAEAVRDECALQATVIADYTGMGCEEPIKAVCYHQGTRRISVDANSIKNIDLSQFIK